MVTEMNKRIHELVRFLETTPEDETAKKELAQLRKERAGEIDETLQNIAMCMSDATEKQLDAEDCENYTSTRAQYRAACSIYRELQALVQRNRELKKKLRGILG